MKNEIFTSKKNSPWMLGFIVVCFALAFYACCQTGKWFIPIPLLPPVLLLLVRHRTRYVVWEDGRVEIRHGLGRKQTLDQLHRLTCSPRTWLDHQIRIDYRDTFEKLSLEHPQAFIEAVRRVNPQLEVHVK